jgi:hypothetical protein
MHAFVTPLLGTHLLANSKRARHFDRATRYDDRALCIATPVWLAKLHAAPTAAPTPTSGGRPSIGAFEHFGHPRYNRFFKMAYEALPADGVMLLHTITRPPLSDARKMGLGLTREIVEFAKFILEEIFPAAGCRRSRSSRSTPARPASL